MAHLYGFEMRFDLGTLDSGERSLPFGLFLESHILADVADFTTQYDIIMSDYIHVLVVCHYV